MLQLEDFRDEDDYITMRIPQCNKPKKKTNKPNPELAHEGCGQL
jgi:hypothetical protein